MTIALVTVVFATLPRASATTITLNSSSAVTYSSSFAASLAPANFSAAQTGLAASVLMPTAYDFSSQVSGPGAVWIGNNPDAGMATGETGVYAISFDVAGPVASASLNLFYAVDGVLHGTTPGIYINGTALPAPTAAGCASCLTSFSQQNNYTNPNIAPLLVTGTNWLYFDTVNQGPEAALIFSAIINTSSPAASPTNSSAIITNSSAIVSAVSATAVPEPSTLLLLGTGLLGVGIAALRRKLQHHQTATYRLRNRFGSACRA